MTMNHGKKSYIVFLALLVPLLVCWGCNPPTNPIPLPPQPTMTPTPAATICAPGPLSTSDYTSPIWVQNPGDFVIRTQTELLDFEQNTPSGGGCTPFPCADPVDFNQYMLVGVSIGMGSTSYQLQIDAVEQDCSQVIVRASTDGPTCWCEMITADYMPRQHFVLIPRSSLPVVFDHTTVDHDLDGDGFSDLAENAAATDCCDAASHP